MDYVNHPSNIYQMTRSHFSYRLLFVFFAFLPISIFGQGFAGDNMLDDVEVVINNETAINTDGLEFSPAFFENGIVFISTRIAGKEYRVIDKDLGTNIMSIYFSERSSEGQLQKPNPFATSLLSVVHEGPLTFNAQNNKIYFTRNNLNTKGKPEKSRDGKNKLKIYSANRSGPDGWSNLVDLGFNSSEFNTAHPSISPDGDRLFFASDRPGGFGGMDIYVVNLEGDRWGAPVNLGPEVNTPQNEIFPFIHADGTLYFTTNGRPGEGGLDIFYTIFNDGQWEKPINFSEINSNADDFGLIIDRDKKNGYFSSNRSGGLGGDDIYRFFVLGDLRQQVPEEELVAEDYIVQVSDEATGLPLEGVSIQTQPLDQFTMIKAITLADRPMDKDEIFLQIPFDKNSPSGISDASGTLKFRLKPGNHIFKAMKDDYNTNRLVTNTNSMDGKVIYIEMNPGSSQSEEVVSRFRDLNGSRSRRDNGYELNGEDEEEWDDWDLTTENERKRKEMQGDDWDDWDDVEYERDIPGLEEVIDSGSVFQLPNIYYNFNDASIRPDARLDLDYLAEFLRKFPTVQIELASHTDSRGSEEYNLNLSRERAENAAQYLISQGIDQQRIIPVGYGESRLRNDCTDGVPCSEAKHQFNRRTAIRILRIGEPINLTIVNEVTEPEVIDYPDLLSEISEGRSEDGRYQVIAGSFKSESNAMNRLQALQALGYNTTRVIFNQSNGLYVVLVEVFQIKSDARNLLDRLNDDGMECFLKVQ